LRLSNAQQVKYLRKQLLRGNEFSLLLVKAQLQRDSLIEDLVNAAYVQAMDINGTLPYTEQAYRAMEESGSSKVVGVANDIESMLSSALGPLGNVRQRLAAIESGKWSDTCADINGQLTGLLGESFLRDTPAASLSQYPRYMKALEIRLERLAGQYPKDQKNRQLLEGVTQPLLDLLVLHPNLLLRCSQASDYRWMLEEFRVSLFAQNLGTKQAVSVKRLQEKWQLVARWSEQNPS
jgi:ATP-dependent helicase HrpA